MQHSNYITHIKNEEDIPFLKSKLFDVNMRLFKTSPEYRHIILDICEYIVWLAKVEKEGYKKPHGMSGANAGIPFNIIAIVRNRGKADEWVETMINPKVVGHSTKVETAFSNCGSLTLNTDIPVARYTEIRITWFDLNGKKSEGIFGRKQNGFTIQHEIEHNLGILITDK